MFLPHWRFIATVLGSTSHFKDPATTIVLDARTGSLRVARARFQGDRLVASASPSSCRAAGKVALVSPESALILLDPATGGSIGIPLVDSLNEEPRLSVPFLTAGGVVAAAVTAREVRAFVPRLSAGTRPSGPVLVGDARLFVNHPEQGPLDEDSRLLAAGDVVYVVRTSRSGRVTAAAFEVDRAALESLRGSDPVVWHPFQRLDPAEATSAGRRSGTVLVAARATLEGLWVLSTQDAPAGDLAPGRASWFEPTRGDLLVSFSTSESVPHPQGPIRVGSSAWVPVDSGFLVLPLARPAAR